MEILLVLSIILSVFQTLLLLIFFYYQISVNHNSKDDEFLTQLREKVQRRIEQRKKDAAKSGGYGAVDVLDVSQEKLEESGQKEVHELMAQQLRDDPFINGADPYL